MDIQTMMLMLQATQPRSHPVGRLRGRQIVDMQRVNEEATLAGEDDSDGGSESESDCTDMGSTADASELDVNEEEAVEEMGPPLSKRELVEAKLSLLRAVTSSLLREPRMYDPDDEERAKIKDLSELVATRGGDPEFLLKTAFHCRTDLGIRTTTNFLIAVASSLPPCRPYLRKYFHRTIILPSDWLEVAGLASTLHHEAAAAAAECREDDTESSVSYLSSEANPLRDLFDTASDTTTSVRPPTEARSDCGTESLGSVPAAATTHKQAPPIRLSTALRRVMSERFEAFDTYHLAKYNNERSVKRRSKRQRAAGVDADKQQKPGRVEYTLKQLVRHLHLSEPKEAVMCILGKRYPESALDFRAAELEGVWDADLAGKRMRLPAPDTWERHVSEKGNRKEVWEGLIDNGNLPFMAMLRNLRNLLVFGVSFRHHNDVLRKLEDESTVAASGHLPLAFLRAHECLDQDAIAKDVASLIGRYKRRQLQHSTVVGGVHSRQTPTRPRDDLLVRYEKALGAAVRHSTAHNMKPLPGKTLVLVDAMLAALVDENATPVRRRGASGAEDVGRLAACGGLMFRHMCEDCDLKLYSGDEVESVQMCGELLDDIGKVHSRMRALAFEWECPESEGFPTRLLSQLLLDGTVVDQIILLAGSADRALSNDSRRLLVRYRQEVNPKVLVVSVDMLASHGKHEHAVADDDDADNSEADDEDFTGSEESSYLGDGNDEEDWAEAKGDDGRRVSVRGFSERLLRFIAECGEDRTLKYVDMIDVVKRVREPRKKKKKKTKKAKKKTDKDPKKPNPLSAFQSKKPGQANAFGTAFTSSVASKPFLERSSVLAPVQSNASALRTSRGFGGFSSPSALPAPSSMFAKAHARSVVTATPPKGLPAPEPAVKKPPAPGKVVAEVVEQARQRHEARVFVSSTFVDMGGERSHLVEKVFPRLAAHFEPRGVTVVPIDLRWGVTEGVLKDKSATRTCLDEVHHSRPFFIAMLGDRYGSTVSEYGTNVADPGDPTAAWLKSYPPGRSVTELEIAHAAMNAPAAGCGVIPHVFLRSSAFMQQVPPTLQQAFKSESSEAAKASKRLRSQVKKWATEGKLTTEDYTCTHGGGSETAGLEAFGEAVFKHLKADIERVHVSTVSGRSLSPSEQHMQYAKRIAERAVNRRDLISKIVGMVRGRDVAAHKRERAKAKDDDGPMSVGVDVARPVVVAGDVGAGKSTVLAAVATQLRREGVAVLCYLHGAEMGTGADGSARSLVRRLLHMARCMLSGSNGDGMGGDGGELGRLRLQLAQTLQRLKQKRGMVAVIVDAGEALREEVDWIPLKHVLGSHFCVAVDSDPITGCKDAAVMQALEKRFGSVREVAVPSLDTTERREVITRMLEQVGKGLDNRASNDQQAMLVHKKGASYPLYLRVACDELSAVGSHVNLSDTIRGLPQSLNQLYANVVRRVSASTAGGKRRRPAATSCLSMLAVSRDGLTEHELRLGLSDKFPEPMPQVLFAPVMAVIASLVSVSGGRGAAVTLRLRNAAVRAAVCKAVRSHVKEAHTALTKVFSHLGDTSSSRRPSLQLPYHLACLGEWARVRKQVCTLGYVANVTRARAENMGQALALFKALRELVPQSSRGGEAIVAAAALAEFEDFMQTHSATLAKRPERLLQLATNMAQGSAIRAATDGWDGGGAKAVLRQVGDQATSALRMRLRPSQDSFPCSAVSGDGTTMVIGSYEGVVYTMDTVTGQLRGQLRGGHSQPVLAVAFSPDDRVVCSAGEDSAAVLWDAPSGNKLHTFHNAHSRAVTGVAFSRGEAGGEALLCTVGMDAKVRMWSLATRQCVITMHSQERPLACCAFMDELEAIVVGDWGGEVRVRHWLSGETMARCGDSMDEAGERNGPRPGEDTSAVRCLDVTSGGRLAVGQASGRVRVWEVGRGEEAQKWQARVKAVFEGHRRPVNAVSWAREGLLVSGSADGTVRLWDARPARCVSRIEILPMGTRGDVAQLVRGSLAPNGYLWASSNDQRLYMLDLRSHAEAGGRAGQARVKHRVDCGEHGVATCVCNATLVVSRTARGIPVTGHSSGAVIAWSPSGNSHCVLARGVDAVAALGPWVVCGTHGGGLHLIRFEATGLTLVQSIDSAHEDTITCLEFQTAPLLNCQVIVTGGRDSVVKVWALDRRNRMSLKGTIGAHRDWISSIAFCPQLNTLVTAGYDQRCLVWDVTQLEDGSSTTETDPMVGLLHEMPSTTTTISAAAFSPSGALLVLVSDKMRVLDQSFEILYELNAGQAALGDRVTDVMFLPSNDEMVVTCAPEAGVLVYSLRAGGQLEMIAGHRGGVNSVQALPGQSGGDGVGLLSTGQDVCLWRCDPVREVDEGAELMPAVHRLKDAGADDDDGDNDECPAIREMIGLARGGQQNNTHGGAVTGVAVSMDGKVAVSCGEDGVLCAWDVEAGGALRWGRQMGCALRGCSLSSALESGLEVAACGDNGNVMAVPLQGGETVAWNQHGEESVRSVTYMNDWPAKGDCVLVSGGWDGKVVFELRGESGLAGTALKAEGKTEVQRRVEKVVTGQDGMFMALCNDAVIRMGSVRANGSGLAATWRGQVQLAHGRIRDINIDVQATKEAVELVVCTQTGEVAGLSFEKSDGGSGAPVGRLALSDTGSAVVLEKLAGSPHAHVGATVKWVIKAAHGEQAVLSLAREASGGRAVISTGEDGRVVVWDCSSGSDKAEQLTEIECGGAVRTAAVGGNVVAYGTSLGGLGLHHLDHV